MNLTNLGNPDVSLGQPKQHLRRGPLHAFLKVSPGTSLVVQWLRLYPPMPGAWIWSLLGELGSHVPPWPKQQQQQKNIFRYDTMAFFHLCYIEQSRELRTTNQPNKSIFGNTNCKTQLMHRNLIPGFIYAWREESTRQRWSTSTLRDELGFWKCLLQNYKELWREMHWWQVGSSPLSGVDGGNWDNSLQYLGTVIFFL